MRYPSARGLGVRYLIAVLLPFSGICLVVYTAVQLAIAHATNTVPPFEADRGRRAPAGLRPVRGGMEPGARVSRPTRQPALEFSGSAASAGREAPVMIVGSSKLVAPMPPKRLPRGNPAVPGDGKRSVARWAAAALLARLRRRLARFGVRRRLPRPRPIRRRRRRTRPSRSTPRFRVIPPAARGFLHPTASRVPPFPREPGARRRRELEPGGQGSGARLRAGASHLRARHPGDPLVAARASRGKPLSARYLCAERAWRGPRYAGPFYVWNGDGSLSERSYRTTDGTRYREDLYQYRASGIVWAYRRRERNEDRTGAVLLRRRVLRSRRNARRLLGRSVERTRRRLARRAVGERQAGGRRGVPEVGRGIPLELARADPPPRGSLPRPIPPPRPGPRAPSGSGRRG